MANLFFLLILPIWFSMSAAGIVHVTKQEAADIRQHCQGPLKSLPADAAYENADKIANGRLYTWGVEAPFVVKIISEIGNCTGSLLSSQHVITAAHCVVRDFCEAGTFEIVPLSVQAWSCWLNPGHECYKGLSVTKLEKYKVIDTFVPKDYRSTKCTHTVGNDFAILTLDNAVSYSMPDIVCLPTAAPVIPAFVRAHGLGRFNEQDTNPDSFLYMADFKVTEDRGNGVYAFKTRDSSHICQGDSGASLITFNGERKTTHFIATNADLPCSNAGGVVLVGEVFKWNDVICEITGICVTGGPGRLMEKTLRLAADQPRDSLYPALSLANVREKQSVADQIAVHFELICKSQDTLQYYAALWESDGSDQSDDLLNQSPVYNAPGHVHRGIMFGIHDGDEGTDGYYEFYIWVVSNCHGRRSTKRVYLEPKCRIGEGTCWYAVRDEL